MLCHALAQIQHNVPTVENDFSHLCFAINNSRENKSFVLS